MQFKRKYAIINSENKNRDVLALHLCIYNIIIFQFCQGKKLLKAEIEGAICFFYFKKIYMEVNGMELLPLENKKNDERFQIFSKENLGSVRTVLIEGEPWFRLKDACSILKINNITDAKNRLNPKGLDNIEVLTNGGKQKVIYINESNLYKLIFNSRKPEAKKFEDWITTEVIPSIRKTGSYSLEYKTPKNYIEALEFLIAAEKEKEKLQLENNQQKQIIAEYEPKATYCDLVLKSPNLVSISLIAKDYGMSAIGLNKLLHDLGIQYKQSGTWLLYQKYANFGYTKSTTFLDEKTGFSKLNTKWTQKGRLFLYETLKANEILPLIEKE